MSQCGSMSTKKTDREIVLEALKLFDREENELHQRPLENDVDTDSFIERAFGNITMPPH
jgi:hypothetical protein